MIRFFVLFVVVALFSKAASSQEQVSFKDKPITMVIGYAAGGGTDLGGRQLARFVGKYLPGQPNIIVHNQPGADGLTALNFVAIQTKPDGLTVTMGSTSQVDPLNYRERGTYDPSKFAYVGGVGRGRNVLVAKTGVEKRLYDPKAQPVMMGSVGVPRSGMQVTAWGIGYLGWNAKWVVGYRGTNEVMLALNRGEIDMTSSADLRLVGELLQTGKYQVLLQAGTLIDIPGVHPDILKAPYFKEFMDGKIKDPIAKQAFDYWISLNSVDKWMALMPGTPMPIVQAYRDAFKKANDDPEFMTTGRAINEDFTPVGWEHVTAIVNVLAGTPNEAVGHTSALLRKQGLDVAK